MAAITPSPVESPLDRVRRPDPAAPRAGPVVGIDLGGTSCRIAVVQNGSPVCISAGQGRTIPSYVALAPGPKIVTGQGAQRLLASNPDGVLWGMKRLLGVPFQSPAVEALRAELRCELREGPGSEAHAYLGGRAFSARELVAMLFCEARELAQNHLREPISRAVVTIPPTRNEALKKAVADAALLAGFNLERTLFEPAAAALAAQWRHRTRGERTAAVYDWGGGKFQMSVVRFSESQCQVLATDADATLGGAMLDRALLNHVLGSLPDGFPREPDRGSFLRIADAVERAKIALSTSAETRIRLPFVTWADGSTRDLDVPVTRATLEALAAPLVEQSIAVCERALERKGMFPGEVDEVLLVGEQTHMPAIRKRAEHFFYKVPLRHDEPGLAVVLGAALAGSRVASGR